MLDAIYQFDFSVLNAIHEGVSCAFLDGIMPLVSMIFGDKGIFWIIMAFAFLCFPKTRKMGMVMGISLLMGVIIGNGLLKNITARPRPYTWEGYEAIRQALLVKEPTDFSFPSGHTLACFEGATSVFLFHKKWGIPALFIAFSVMFSRMYLFVHYPSDVACGMLLGILFACLSYLLVQKLYARYHLDEVLLFPFEKKRKA